MQWHQRYDFLDWLLPNRRIPLLSHHDLDANLPKDETDMVSQFSQPANQNSKNNLLDTQVFPMAKNTRRQPKASLSQRAVEDSDPEDTKQAEEEARKKLFGFQLSRQWLLVSLVHDDAAAACVV